MEVNVPLVPVLSSSWALRSPSMAWMIRSVAREVLPEVPSDSPKNAPIFCKALPDKEGNRAATLKPVVLPKCPPKGGRSVRPLLTVGWSCWVDHGTRDGVLLFTSASNGLDRVVTVASPGGSPGKG